MNGVRSRLVGLCLVPMLFALLDGGLTLAGQSSAYWSGEYHQVNEASPTFRQLLIVHPLAFAGGILTWIGIFVAIILLLPDTLALTVSITVTFGHSVGALTWMIWRFQYGYQMANLLFLVAGILLATGIQRGWQARPAEDYRLPLSPLARGLVSLLLFGIGVYLFLWPRS